jgi:DNA-directed RNA polymerase subunit RPC12/RpoP
VLCGQCGQVNELDEGYREPTVACSRCGHVIAVAAFAQEAPPAEQQPAHDAAAEEPGFAEQARQSNGRKITITCANCGKTVSVSARVAGRNARCKGCDFPIVIPYPDDLEQFELPKLQQGEADHEDGLELVAPPVEPGPE